MIYLSGVTNDRIEPALIGAGIGLMLNPGNSYHLRAARYPWVGIDNGAFGGKWDEDTWMDRLGHLATMDLFGTTLFAVSPDVYDPSDPGYSARESLRRGMEFLPIIRDTGFPVAVVAQDQEPGELHWDWDAIDVLFVGGISWQDRGCRPSQEWKESAAAGDLIREARRHGVWPHAGRVNSLRRRCLRVMRDYGCLSADGTFLKYRKRRTASDVGDERHGRGEGEIGAWLSALDHQPSLWRFESPSHRLFGGRR